MSAFVVDLATMHRVVRGIVARNRYGQIIRTFAGIATDALDAPTEIGRRLFTLNVEAVMQRYPDCQDNPSNLPGTEGCSAYPRIYQAPRQRPARPDVAPLVDSLKALECLRYQCSEGDVPASAALYRELGDAIGALACAIVSTLPAYEAAPWDSQS